MVGINVIETVQETVTRHATRDEWDRDDSYTSRSIEGISIAKGYGDVAASFEPKKGETYYLLYTWYSTGDSFGTDDGAASAIYHELYDSREKAEKALEALKTPVKINEGKKYSLDYTGYLVPDNNGELMKVYPSWEGYFESLEDQGIKEVQLI